MAQEVVMTDQDKLLEVMHAVQEMMDRLNPDPANGLQGLLVAWVIFAKRVIQAAETPATRQANLETMLDMLRIAGVDLRKTPMDEESSRREREAGRERFLVGKEKGEVWH